MKKLVAASLLLLAFAGCYVEAPKPDTPLSVRLLFEYEGVRVYRFMDDGRYVYYTDARGETIDTVGEPKTLRNQTVPNR